MGTNSENPEGTEYLAEIIGQIGDGVAVAAFDGTITYVNDAWAEMHGYRREELEGKHLSLFHSEHQMTEDVLPFNEQVMANGRHHGRVGHITRSGREFETLMTTTILRDREGRPVEMVAVARDITNDIVDRRALETRGRYLACLAEISTRMIESTGIMKSLPEILRLLGEAAVVSRTYIFKNAIDTDGRLECSQVASWSRPTAPPPPPEIDQRHLPYVANGLRRWVEILGSGSILAENISEMPLQEQARLEPFGIKSLLLIPLFVSDRWFGYIGFDCCRDERSWSDEEIALLKVAASQISAAIENNRLLEEILLDATALERSNRELKRAYEETLEGWARALELRDSDTEGHTRRVADMTRIVGERMGLSEDAMVHLYRGALLHDIGKMAIPDHILKKAGPLNDEEWAIMKTHPIHAYEMLSRIEYLRPALAIPCSHHERWDGSGYPQGLKGEDIPLAARIFSVVDVWDALQEDRPYRKAWPKDRIIDYLRENAGSQFDPNVVTVFLSILDPAG